MNHHAISPSMWAFIFVAFGVLTILVCKYFGVSAEVGAGIVGAGLNAFNNQLKQTQNVDHADTVNQVTDTK